MTARDALVQRCGSIRPQRHMVHIGSMPCKLHPACALSLLCIFKSTCSRHVLPVVEMQGDDLNLHKSSWDTHQLSALVIPLGTGSKQGRP